MEAGRGSMSDVYRFKVRLKEFEDIIWRDIEITSVSSVAKLGYAVIAAFEGTASHLFCIHFKGKQYEILFEEPDIADEPIIDPVTTKLSRLDLSAGDELTMEYDYGAGWEFSIKLISIAPMKRGAGTHYPYIADGGGKGIIEDSSPGELLDIIHQTDTAGTLATVYDGTFDCNREWDYRKFDKEFLNVFYKGDVHQFQIAYEEFEK